MLRTGEACTLYTWSHMKRETDRDRNRDTERETETDRQRQKQKQTETRREIHRDTESRFGPSGKAVALGLGTGDMTVFDPPLPAWCRNLPLTVNGTLKELS